MYDESQASISVYQKPTDLYILSLNLKKLVRYQLKYLYVIKWFFRRKIWVKYRYLKISHSVWGSKISSWGEQTSHTGFFLLLSKPVYGIPRNITWSNSSQKQDAANTCTTLHCDLRTSTESLQEQTTSTFSKKDYFISEFTIKVPKKFNTVQLEPENWFQIRFEIETDGPKKDSLKNHNPL